MEPKPVASHDTPPSSFLSRALSFKRSPAIVQAVDAAVGNVFADRSSDSGVETRKTSSAVFPPPIPPAPKTLSSSLKFDQAPTKLEKDADRAQNESRDRRLLQIVENVSGDPQLAALASALCLHTEAVIKSEMLFEAILKKISSSNAESSLQQLQGTLRFCSNWLTHNQRTPLLPKASKQLAKIADILKTHSDNTVHNLLREIQTKLEAPPAAPSTSQIRPKADFDFQKLLEPYLAVELLPDLDAIAEDFLYFHWKIIQNIEPNHLITTKWYAMPAPVKRLIDYFNHFSDYIVLRIQSEKKREKKVRVAEFFLYLADTCEKRCDFATPLIILSALNRSETGSLADKLLDAPCDAIFNRLKELFENRLNFRNLRSKLKSAAGTFHIPYHGILHGDLRFKMEVPGEETLGGQTYCNESKLLQIQDMITNFLAIKSLPFPNPERFPDRFYTDLPFLVEEMGSPDS